MHSRVKKVAILYRKKEECCGCAACAAICPVEAIDMEIEEEGFYYPIVDEEKCIQCKACLNICSFKPET